MACLFRALIWSKDQLGPNPNLEVEVVAYSFQEAEEIVADGFLGCEKIEVTYLGKADKLEPRIGNYKRLSSAPDVIG